MEIEFYTIDWRGDHAVVHYGMFEGNTQAQVRQDVMIKELTNFITENRLNILEVYNNTQSDIVEYTLSVEDYLRENYEQILKQYITQHAN